MEDDGFTLYKPGRAGRRKPAPRPVERRSKAAQAQFQYRRSAPSGKAAGKTVTAANLIAEISFRKKSIQASKFYAALKENLQARIGAFRDPPAAAIDVVCYGVGSMTAQSSQHQFALILLLREDLEFAGSFDIFDPVMSDIDRPVMLHFGCSMIAENERGARSVTAHTLFYMPHCGHILYDAVLRSNWASLPTILVVGNSFAAYDTLLQARDKRNQAPYLLAAGDLVEEVPFPKVYEVPDVFNNTSLHLFKQVGGTVELAEDYGADCAGSPGDEVV
ncbi:hypothetical protein HDU88_003347 [Geranomyces variabilis]|nr:hypothetical protein HDU88_003347 [Geranomyces variabilis]